MPLKSVVIKGLERNISDEELYFKDNIMTLYQNKEWQNLLVEDTLFAGPFCWVQDEMDIPF
ncbi:MAG: hypothetical protein ACKE51_00020 [Methylococcaceae bacterium]